MQGHGAPAAFRRGTAHRLSWRDHLPGRRTAAFRLTPKVLSLRRLQEETVVEAVTTTRLEIIRVIRVPKAMKCPWRNAPSLLPYCVCNAFAGLSRAARAAGITVASTVIEMMSSVAIARISGSDARIAYTRFAMSWPEKYANATPTPAPTRPRIAPCFITSRNTERGDAPSARRVAISSLRSEPAYDTTPQIPT